MDTGEGRFESLSDEDLKQLEKIQEKHPNHGGVFHEGEVVELKGSKFKIRQIKENRMLLYLLPKGE